MVRLIMQCTTRSSILILWNGKKLESFKHSRGIRQGDPLSSYLFMLYIEVLSQSIYNSVRIECWKGIKPSWGEPILSHLCFDDDVLLFGEAIENQDKVMENILNTFCTIFGEKVNLAKSKLCFSRNMSSNMKETLSQKVGIP